MLPEGRACVKVSARLNLILLVYKENTFTHAIIEVAPEQHVASTGPYAIVRHPMYVPGTLIFSVMPLALGSYWGLFPSVVMLPALIWRLLGEERFLGANLPGYSGYTRKVCWRLLPGIF